MGSAAASITDRPARRPRKLDELTAALGEEISLMRELRDALLGQRGAIAANDRGMIELSINRIGRVLLSIEAARKRRSSLAELMSELERAGVTTAADELDRKRLGATREKLMELGKAVARDIAINQHVLRKAIEAGDAFLQQLFSDATSLTPVYKPSGNGESGGSNAVLVNRTA